MQKFDLLADPIAGIPCLLMEPSGSSKATPLVVVLHGLTRHKENMLPALYEFACHGLRAIALDARLHGERSGAGDLEDRLQQDYLSTMNEIISGTVQDVTHILDALDIDKAAIHGVSLGGYITFAALVHEPRLAAAAVAIGSPDLAGPLRQFGLGPGHPLYEAVAAVSPLERAAETFPPRPLLMLHGDQDGTVPVYGVQALQQRLAPLYQDFPERLKLVIYPGLDHSYTDEMVRRSVEWLARYMIA